MNPNSGTLRLLDVKGATMCATWYVPSPADGAHADASGYAVRRRAALVPKEYLTKAKAADAKYHLSPPGTTGPIERRLREFGPVVPLVFGWSARSTLSSTRSCRRSQRLARLVTGEP